MKDTEEKVLQQTKEESSPVQDVPMDEQERQFWLDAKYSDVARESDR